MPSKTSKTPRSQAFLWKDVLDCSESELPEIAFALASEVKSGDRILLEGPMGAGKTTFARALLHAFGVDQPPEGSPTFAIAHEYDSRKATIVHIDLYRIRHESEIEEAGLPDHFWDPGRIAICEWLSMWPEFEAQVLGRGRNWRVDLGFPENAEIGDSLELPNHRKLKVRFEAR